MGPHIPSNDANEEEEFETDSNDAPHVDLFRPVVDGRVMRNFWRVFIGGMIGFGLCVEFYKRYLDVLPAPAPPLIASAAVGIAIALSLPRRRIWTAVEMHDDALILVDLRSQVETIPWQAVRSISGEAGLSFDGGEILLWKWVCVSTSRDTVRLRMEHQSESCYVALLKHCFDAIGVSYTGDVHLPLRAGSMRLAISQYAAAVSDEFRRQLRRAWICALGAGIASVASAILLPLAWKNVPAEDQDSLGKLTVGAIVLWVVTFLLSVYAARRWLLARRAIARIRNASAAERDSRTGHHWTIAAK